MSIQFDYLILTKCIDCSTVSLAQSGVVQRTKPAPDDHTDVEEYARLKAGQVPFTPFDAGYPKKVVVLTYQRCGSSFFGQLFNTNPDVFYMYEPLDSVYTAMYGTKEGWNVPSDITSYWDGTERYGLIFHHVISSIYCTPFKYCIWAGGGGVI